MYAENTNIIVNGKTTSVNSNAQDKNNYVFVSLLVLCE